MRTWWLLWRQAGSKTSKGANFTAGLPRLYQQAQDRELARITLLLTGDLRQVPMCCSVVPHWGPWISGMSKKPRESWQDSRGAGRTGISMRVITIAIIERHLILV